MCLIQPTTKHCPSPNWTSSWITEPRRLPAPHAPARRGGNPRRLGHHTIACRCTPRRVLSTRRGWKDPTSPSVRQHVQIVLRRFPRDSPWPNTYQSSLEMQIIWCHLHIVSSLTRMLMAKTLSYQTTMMVSMPAGQLWLVMSVGSFIMFMRIETAITAMGLSDMRSSFQDTHTNIINSWSLLNRMWDWAYFVRVHLQ